MTITLEGLTEEQREVVSLVRQFTDEQIIPVASDLERDDIFPDQIVAGLNAALPQPAGRALSPGRAGR